MTNDKRPLELDDIYKTPIGDLLALSDQDLDALIVSAEEAYQKARKLKAWLNGVKRQKAKPRRACRPTCLSITNCKARCIGRHPAIEHNGLPM